jgi:hypothetical protein
MYLIVSKILIEAWYKTTKVKPSYMYAKGKEIAPLNTHIKNKLCSQKKAVPITYFEDIICF